LHSKIWRDLANLFYKLADPPYYLAGNSALDCAGTAFIEDTSWDCDIPPNGALNAQLL